MVSMITWKMKKRTCFGQRNPNGKYLKIKYQQRGVKLKFPVDKKAILHKRLFSTTLPNKILLLESI